MQVASDLPEGTVLWLSSFSRSHAPVAEFAILPTRQGWLQLLCSGDGAFKKYEAKYVRNETIAELHRWWELDFTRYEVTSVPFTQELRERFRAYDLLFANGLCQGAQGD